MRARPAEWWRERPWEADRPLQAVAIRLEPDLSSSGWIDLHLALGDTCLRLALSELYDPLPLMLDWLQAVAEGNLPVAFDIYDEHRRWRLRAHQGPGDSVLLVIAELGQEQVGLAALVDRRALVDELRGALRRLLDTLRRLPRDAAPWDPHGNDLQAYFDGLGGHAVFSGRD